MRFLTIPAKALALYAILGLGGMVGGGTLVAWFAPLGIALIGRRDLTALTQMPRQFWIIPVVPSWYTEIERNVWNLGALIAIVGAGFCMHWGVQFWHYLVVEKFKWMTEKQVEEFNDRMPEG